jgi:hypothetical protein
MFKGDFVACFQELLKLSLRYYTQPCEKQLFSGNKKTPITALFSHLKHPFTKVNSLVSNALNALFLTFS